MPSCLQRGADTPHSLSGDWVPRKWGKRETIPNTTLSPPVGFCIKVGSDESHFDVSLTVGSKITKTVSINHKFWRERKAKADLNQGPSAYQPYALPVGQTIPQEVPFPVAVAFTTAEPIIGQIWGILYIPATVAINNKSIKTEVSIAPLTTHAWAASQRFTMTSKM